MWDELLAEHAAAGTTGKLLQNIYDIVYDMYPPLTPEDFRTNPGTGTATTPENINDNNVNLRAAFDAIDEYVEVRFDHVYRVNQYRHYGFAFHNADGSMKIQYWDFNLDAWIEWVTGIPTNKAVWSEWASATKIMTNKVRVVATTLDTRGAQNVEGEWEMKYA